MKRSLRTPALLSGGALVAAVAAVALAAAAAGPARPGGTTGTAGGTTGTSRTVDLGPVQRVALTTFTSCDALLAYYRRHAREAVGPYGLEGGPEFARAAREEGGPVTTDTQASAPGASAQSKGVTSATGTNVQVGGVDEADEAKFAGDLLLSISDGVLHVSRAEGGRVRPLGAFRPTDWRPERMLLEGTRVLLIGSMHQLHSVPPQEGATVDSTMPGYGRTRSRLAELDLGDPTGPRLVRTLDVDGFVSGARLVDGVARVAVTSSPAAQRWHVLTPDRDGRISKSALRRATERNRSLVDRLGVDAWLPTYELTGYDAAGGREGEPRRGRLVDCPRIAAPPEFAGLDVLSLLGLDLRSGGVENWAASGVVASGSTVYATATRTYVATPRWGPSMSGPTAQRRADPQVRTSVHLFSSAPSPSTDRTGSRYVASGEVPGTLVGQFAMDEHDGRLRVASTTEQGFGGVAVEPGQGDDAAVSRPPSSPPRSQSQVTVLQPQGRRLVKVGAVGGLGKGETIRSVRFMGELGYVVTFRQTDPLYTIDLSEPRRPRVAGELKILGYSAYLHPAGAGRLIGIGQDADREGRVSGMQMSLFDVSDPATPRRLDAVGLDGAWSDVESDHHAFTMAGGLALAPFEIWGAKDDGTAANTFDTGVLAVRVATGDLSRAGVLRPLVDGPTTLDAQGTGGDLMMRSTPRRTFVRDGVIYTVTASGIATHDAGTLERRGFAAF